jgi:hypothetical protein
VSVEEDIGGLKARLVVKSGRNERQARVDENNDPHIEDDLDMKRIAKGWLIRIGGARFVSETENRKPLWGS